jgi:hypothetical protein
VNLTRLYLGVAILAWLLSSATGQTTNHSGSAPHRIPWEPPDSSFSSTVPAATIPDEMVTSLRVAGWPIVLEETDLKAAQRKFGGRIGTRGDAGDAEEWLCLYQQSGTDGWVLWLTSGEIDGGRIGGFIWRSIGQDKAVDTRCVSVEANRGTVELPISLRPGMTEAQAESILGMPSAKLGDTSTYEHEHKVTIRHEPYTAMNTVGVVYRNGLVWGIAVDKSTTN